MATSKSTRFFMGFMALLFLASASAFVIAIVVQHYQNQTPSGTTTSQQSKQTNNQGAKLTGTKMQNFTPLTQPLSKLETIDTKVGTGPVVKTGDTVTADYVGALADTGTIFDASQDHGGPQTFPLSGVIQGWQLGIPGMKVGGTRRLLIPAAMGYGAQGSGSAIPPNSDLVFDVTIVKID